MPGLVRHFHDKNQGRSLQFERHRALDLTKVKDAPAIRQ